MPCFKGLAVSIHTPNGPLPEYSIQKNNRVARIASYIPVPTPQLSHDTAGTAPSTFAVSITLLVPNQAVPYSAPAPTKEKPNPESKYVGSLPGIGEERGRYNSAIGPYVPLTQSGNETIAAYIHFDGRAKEEVATLLRRGEETWVNSRWVSVPISEGGGLAEREFLFREVGLERWLNGLDLQGEGKDVARRIERRKQRLEKKRRKRESIKQESSDEDTKDGLLRGEIGPRARRERAKVLRYGDNTYSPTEAIQDDSMSGSDSDESGDDIPEAAGQIKVSLFRVLASGEVKRGEYSPQFDAHDDDEMDKGDGQSTGNTADVDHTTTFAKPKTLDPKSISTQTVTGIDPPDRPFASFTFFYRGKKQLQKMGILSTADTANTSSTQPKAKSKQMDASSLGKLKAKEGTVGFTGYRDSAKKSTKAFGEKSGKSGSHHEMDSDADDEDETAQRGANGLAKVEVEEDGKDVVLSAEEVSRRGELAEGVKKMKLKRQHSFEAPTPSAAATASATNNNEASTPTSTSGFHDQASFTAGPGTSPTTSINGSNATAIPAASLGSPHLQQLKGTSSTGMIESPFKKQRASLEDHRPTSTFAGRIAAGQVDNGSGNASGADATGNTSFEQTTSGPDNAGGRSATPNPLAQVEGQESHQSQEKQNMDEDL